MYNLMWLVLLVTIASSTKDIKKGKQSSPAGSPRPSQSAEDDSEPVLSYVKGCEGPVGIKLELVSPIPKDSRDAKKYALKLMWMYESDVKDAEGKLEVRTTELDAKLETFKAQGGAGPRAVWTLTSQQCRQVNARAGVFVVHAAKGGVAGESNQVPGPQGAPKGLFKFLKNMARRIPNPRGEGKKCPVM